MIIDVIFSVNRHTTTTGCKGASPMKNASQLAAPSHAQLGKRTFFTGTPEPPNPSQVIPSARGREDVTVERPDRGEHVRSRAVVHLKTTAWQNYKVLARY